MPVMPPAPGRFSITMGPPSSVAIFSVRTRLMKSDGPPAGNGTTNLMGRSGNSWAASAPGQASTPSRQRTRTRVDMRHAPRGGAGVATWLGAGRPYSFPSASTRRNDKVRAPLGQPFHMLEAVVALRRKDVIVARHCLEGTMTWTRRDAVAVAIATSIAGITRVLAAPLAPSLAALCPTGRLRAALIVSNPVLVTRRSDGTLGGV